VYISSADWMTRNLDRRVELLCRWREGRQKVVLALDAILRDNVKARRLQPDGSYRRRRPAKGEDAYRSQIELHREAKRAAERLRAAGGVTLEPLRSPVE
jgi:polyphosphate kinase